MSITGTKLANLIPVTNVTTAELLNAINWAIAHAWPQIKLTTRAENVGTLSASTFVYTLSALDPAPHPDTGVAAVYVQRGNGEPPVLERRVRQRYDQSVDAWTLIFSPDAVSEFDTKAFDVEYQYPHPPIDAIGDTIYMSDAYLVPAVMYWVAQRRLTDQPHDARYWRDIMLLNEEQMRTALKRQRTPWLPMLMKREDTY